MSSTDPLPPDPEEVPPPDPPLPSEAARPAPPYWEMPAAEGIVADPPPDWPAPPPRGWYEPEPRRPHPNFGWSILWCLLFLFVTQVLAAVAGLFVLLFVYLVSPRETAQDLIRLHKPAAGAVEMSPEAVGLLQATSEVTVVLFSLLAIRLVMGRDWRRQVALRAPNPVHVVLTLAALPAFIILGEGSYTLVGQFLPSMGDLLDRVGVHGAGVQEAIQQFKQLSWWFGVLVIGVGPGVGEELWCRGFLGRGLVGRYGPVLGVLLTSFWFGFIHIDPQQGVYAMLLGIGLHCAYLATRSLWVPVLLHFGNNALEILAPKLPGAEDLLRAPAQAPRLVYPAAAVFLALVAWALYQSRARLVAADGGPPLWRPEYPGVELPPPGSGTVVAHRRPRWFVWVLLVAAGELFVAAVAYAV